MIPANRITLPFSPTMLALQRAAHRLRTTAPFNPAALACARVSLRLRRLLFGLVSLLVVTALVPAAHAHVGSKDVFETVHAGPYTLYVTVRPPLVIPGIATVEVRSSGAAIHGLQIVPLPVTGEAAKHPPAADIMTASTADPAFFTGAIWIMAAGTWQVRFAIDGAAGPMAASVPVLAVPVTTLKMDHGLSVTLALLGLFLFVSMAGIVAACVGEARVQPGVTPPPALRRKALQALVMSLVVMGFIVWGGATWWHVEAAGYSDNIFKPAPTTANLAGDRLDLLVASVGTDNGRGAVARKRKNDDYLADHGRLMHLYAIRWPEMDAAYHLHPDLVAPGDFRLNLPQMPAGHYRLFGDVVHANGFPETLVSQIDVPATLPGTPLGGEDASAKPAPLSAGDLGSSYLLPDGYTMIWDKPASLAASSGYTFHFSLVDPQGRPATDMQPYLGMAGHAAFVKTDGQVFAHTHPDGSAAMADLMLADQTMGDPAMDGMQGSQHIAPAVDFPYGFPSAGRYRIFVQMKHANTVETGVFDAEVK